MRAIVFPEISSDLQTSLCPVDQPSAYCALLSSSALALLGPGHPEHLAALGTGVRHAQAFALRLGRDCLVAPTRAARLVLDAL